MDVEYGNELDIYYDKWLALKHKVKMLESGPGGIMEMKQTIAIREAQIDILQEELKAQTESVLQECMVIMLSELTNTNALTSMPPQSSAIWNARNKINARFGVKYGINDIIKDLRNDEDR